MRLSLSTERELFLRLAMSALLDCAIACQARDCLRASRQPEKPGRAPFAQREAPLSPPNLLTSPADLKLLRFAPLPLHVCSTQTTSRSDCNCAHSRASCLSRPLLVGVHIFFRTFPRSSAALTSS